MENFKISFHPTLLFRLCTAFILVFSGNSLAVGSETQFVAIAYHDVVDTREELASDAVTTDHLINQFEWLLAHDYHPVSIDDLIAANRGEKQLPEKAVLLCWDDGYTSFYERVFPLLRAYNFPAVLALVGSWLEPEPSATVLYGDNKVPRTKFLTWQQIKELDQSGLVEIASHSYYLHNGILADAAGDRLPAVITHLYNSDTQKYETDSEHQQRIFNDLQKNSTLIKKHLDHAPRVMVWPFGRYNSAALQAAGQAGMPITLTLDPVPGDINNLQEIGRVYPTLNPGLAEFRSYLNLEIAPPIRHFFKVDTPELLDASGKEVHFSSFLDRLIDIKPDMVTFEPTIFSEDTISSLFINDRFPLEQDRLTRLTWHTSRRGGTGTFLWLSSLLFSSDAAKKTAAPTDFFRQLGKFGFSQGLLIDFPRLTKELLAAAAGEVIQEQQVTFWNPAQRRRARKNRPAGGGDSVISATFQQLESFQYWQPFVEVGLVVSVDLLPELNRTTTQFLLNYFDFILLDARHYEGVTLENRLHYGLTQLHLAGLLSKISVLIKHDGSDRALTGRLADLPNQNIINWGYEYDNFLDRQPSTLTIRPFMSKSSYPFR